MKFNELTKILKIIYKVFYSDKQLLLNSFIKKDFFALRNKMISNKISNQIIYKIISNLQKFSKKELTSIFERLSFNIPNTNEINNIVLSGLNINLTQFYLKIFSKKDLQKIINLVKFNLLNIPISKILKKKYFYESDFIINDEVLDPRPETEILVNQAITYLHDKLKNSNETIKILDLGIGSGCILISIINYFKNYNNIIGYGVDISEKALYISMKNIKKHNLQNKIILLKGDWFNIKNFFFESKKFDKNLSDDSKNSIKLQNFDMIVSNPPYVDHSYLNEVTKNTVNDPKIALFSKNIENYEKIIKNADKYLKNSGKIIFEMGINQNQKIINKIQENKNLKYIKTIKDFNKIDRILIAEKLII